MWHLGAWFSSSLGSTEFMVSVNDFKGLLQNNHPRFSLLIPAPSLGSQSLEELCRHKQISGFPVLSEAVFWTGSVWDLDQWEIIPPLPHSFLGSCLALSHQQTTSFALQPPRWEMYIVCCSPCEVIKSLYAGAHLTLLKQRDFL